MELTFEQENFISDIQYEDRKLRELDLKLREFEALQEEEGLRELDLKLREFEALQEEEGRIIGFHSNGRNIRPVYDETQNLLDEVYEDIPEEDSDLQWLDDFYTNNSIGRIPSLHK